MVLRQDGAVTHLMYYEGAHMLARDLGFMNASALKGWAERHPEIWGNRRGERMFAGDGAAAFGKPPYTPVMVSGIVAWWRAVADRLDATIPVHRDRADALAAHARHDPDDAAGRHDRALRRQLAPGAPALSRTPAVAAGLTAFPRRPPPSRRPAAALPAAPQREESGGREGEAVGPVGAVRPAPLPSHSTHHRGRFA